MADAYLGEIRINAFNYAPKGWAACSGQLLPVTQNQALYSLLANTFGGTSGQTFALPNLQGRTAIHPDGSGYLQGGSGGEANHMLGTSEIPSHTHQVFGSSVSADTKDPSNAVLGTAQNANLYGPASSPTAIEASTISSVGGQPHNNMQPYLGLNFCIALQGVYPSRP